ncbi:MAG: hypothetical protein HDR25_04155 [Lachnospiraceae bacterium]|nr:hypothetical protein [Lachnospiraceae bacterium]
MTIGSVYGYQPYNSIYTSPIGTSRQPQDVNPVSGVEEEKKSANPDEVKKPGRKSSPADCETCKNRKYQDGSDEGNVSFKSPSHISPESAAAKVRAHENEHVSNAYKKAAKKNGKVMNASVSIQTAICPECGRTYVSGGLTKTSIKYKNEDNPYTKNQKELDALQLRGANVDYAA